MKTVASREIVYNALLALMQTVTQLKTCTRKLKHWKDVPKELQPALYIEHTGEVTTPSPGKPARIVLEINFWVYVNTDGEEVGPILNPVLDAIGAVLEPKNGDYVTTLNGLVHHCWIEGQTQIFEGDLGEEAVAIIPVKLLVT